ncbi:MAG: hypothetical protein KAJ48_10460, partial [Elusimicrobiales bacterium]|nr:hypothetical protein [Elusimicrobiales bacterium]
IKVYFKDYSNNPLDIAKENYAIVAHIIKKTPELSVSVQSSVLYLKTSESFTTTMTITNSGGYIVAGTTAAAKGSGSFGGDFDQPRFVGNLMHQFASKTTAFNLITPSTEGNYTLTMGANGINKGLIGATAPISVIVDDTPPTGSISIDELSYTSSTILHLTLSASDDRSGISKMQFKNDGLTYGSWEDYSTSMEWPIPSGDGIKKVWVKYKDKSGNINEYSAQTTFDSQGPLGTININNNVAITSSTAVTLNLTSSDSGGMDKMQFKNEGGSWSAWEDCSTSKVWTLLSGDGEKTVYVRFRDTIGNISEYSDSIMLDSQGLTGEGILINNNAQYSNTTSVNLTLSASGGVTHMQIKNESGGTWTDWLVFNSPHSWELDSSADGTRRVYVRYKDGAGNISNTVDNTIYMDRVSPSGSISINSGDTQTAETSVTLTLSASDPSPASGIYQMRFSNDGSSWEPWENYSTSKAWTLVAGTGLKTVWVEFIDNIGNTSSYEDSIFLTAGCDTIRIDNGAQYVWDRFDVPLTLNDCES